MNVVSGMKRTFKSCIALLVAFGMMITLIQPAIATPSDVKPHWAAKELESWVNQKLLQGYADGSLHPDANITRAEFVTFINRVLNLTKKSAKTFPDVKANEWYADSIAKAVSAGIIQGDSNGRMNPTAPITRQEAAAVVARAFKLKGDASAANAFVDSSAILDWAKASIGAMKSNGYIAGRDGNKFAPASKITRAETVKMIDNAMGELISSTGTYSGNKNGNLVVNTKDVVLSDMTIKGNLYLTEGIGEGNVAMHNVKVAGTTFVEGGGPNSIEVENSSLGNVEIIKKDGNVRVVMGKGSSAASITISSGAILENNSETTIDHVTIKDNADGSQTITIRGNVANLTVEGKMNVVLEGGTVTNLTLNAAATIGGNGKIENATINAQGSTLGQKPVHTTFKDGITATIAGKQEGATQNGTTQGGTGTTGGGNGGDPNPPTEEFNGTKIIGGHDIVLFKDEIAWLDVRTPKTVSNAEADWTIPENGVIVEDDDHGNKRAIKAKGPGVETVSVSFGNESDSVNVIVANYNVKLTLNNKVNSTADLASIMAPGKTATDWASLSPEVATIDSDGKVTAVKVGNTVVSAMVDGQPVRTRVIVDPDPDKFEPLNPIDISKRPTTAQTVKPNVTAANVGQVLQKKVTKYSFADNALPQNVKDYIGGTIQAPADKAIPQLTGTLPGEMLPVDESDVKFSVADTDGTTTWLATSKGVVRINTSESYSRDVVQFFATQRYLPDDDVRYMLADGNGGVWAVTNTGVSHIEMIAMGYEEKAQMMSDNLQENNSRRGPNGQQTLPFLSEGYGSPGNYRGYEQDNDGLWTADAIAGEMFRTAVEEAKNPNSTQAKEARARATKSVEADLLLMYVTGRAGQIEAKIKMLPYSTMDTGMMSYSYLKAGGNKNNPDDYVYAGPAATEKRTIQGFISRTMGIDLPGYDQHTNWDGIFYKKGLTIDGKSYSYNTTKSLTDPTNIGNQDVRKKGWGEFAGSVVNSANPIPERLAKLYTDLGATEQDLYYKGDTSADEILGHMYLYKIAYDTLCTGPNADNELGELIANAAGEFARHIINNGYTITDITGQPTVHGKYNGDTFGRTEDAGEDTELRAAELMTIFKTVAYVTGNQMFLNEYRKVAREYIYPSVFENEDAYNDVVNGIKGVGPLAGAKGLEDVAMPPQNGYAKGYMQRLNHRWASYYYASRRDGDPHPFTWYNYSDERQAMFTFYNLIAIPDQAEDQDIAVMIRAGIDNWYQSNMQYEDEPLWDYIYQLAYPNELKIDLKKTAWVLKRTPIDRTDYAVNLTGRKDISWFVTKAIVTADDGYNSKVSNESGLVTAGGVPVANGIVYDPATKQYTKQAVMEGDLFVARTRRQEGRHVQTAVKDNPTLKVAVSPDERPLTRPGDSMFAIDDGGSGAWDYGNAFNAPYWMARYYGMITQDQ
ncbi:S-layer homology domain-containing protein [Cohnella sp. NL03-T5]|uniref:S-layer homology domain-containing protein n=1 Tax=Cohnella silvisoli TaxID=2873699 RepID=A0ABV1KMM7_9BACL|nr:S-layer homology domain-containing protein [Cohnella silvisoli]MCD9020329.1 S-layer homology domain-containing protein [Cohnella silvisoli]